MARSAQRYLDIGDRLLRRGRFKHAAAAYARSADAFLAETFISTARACVQSDPLKALEALSRAERLVGPSGEGRVVSAQAYMALGQQEIAANFLRAGDRR